MAFRQREIFGYVVDADGVAVTNSSVLIQPNEPLGYTADYAVVDRVVQALTDSSGHFSATIWCDEDSLNTVDYNISFPVANDSAADPTHKKLFSLAYGDGSPISVGILIAAGLPAPDPEGLLVDLIDSRIALNPPVAAMPFKMWAGYITQAGTAAPTVDSVIFNSLGGTITWSYVTVGVYRGTLSGAFPSGKFFALFQIPIATGSSQRKMTITRIDSNTIELQTITVSTPANDLLFVTPVQFFVTA